MHNHCRCLRKLPESTKYILFSEADLGNDYHYEAVVDYWDTDCTDANNEGKGCYKECKRRRCKPEGGAACRKGRCREHLRSCKGFRDGAPCNMKCRKIGCHRFSGANCINEICVRGCCLQGYDSEGMCKVSWK